MNRTEKVLEQRDSPLSFYFLICIEHIVANNSHPTMKDDGKKVSGMNVKKPGEKLPLRV